MTDERTTKDDAADYILGHQLGRADRATRLPPRHATTQRPWPSNAYGNGYRDGYNAPLPRVPVQP